MNILILRALRVISVEFGICSTGQPYSMQRLIRFEELDARLMVRALPGLFCAGEMLDWEAPTGGYLLTACFASGRAAGAGAIAWLKERHD